MNNQPDWCLNEKPAAISETKESASSPTTSGVSTASATKAAPVKPPKKEAKLNTAVYFGAPTSINAIFFASILLGSRLKKTSKVFTLLYISLCIFGFIPILRHLMRHRLRMVYDLYALISSIALAHTIFQQNPLFGILYVCFVVFISFLSPLIFIYAYQFKNDIRGPWDCPQVK